MAQSVISEFESRRVARFLRELYAGKLRPDETLEVSGSREGEWLAVRWELQNAAETRHYVVDARVDLRIQRLREREAVDLLYDFLGVQFAEFLTTGEPFTGLNWERVEFAGKALWLRGQVLNPAAERAGDGLQNPPPDPAADTDLGCNPRS